jgi:hypothetical protein
MSIIGRVAKLAYKMTPKRKAALAKAVKASALARAKSGAKAVAKKTASSVVKVAKNPVKAYTSSVARRTTKSRVKSLARTRRKLTSAKAVNPRLASTVNSTSIEARIATGARAAGKTDYDRLSKVAASATANLDNKGGAGVLGYARKRSAKNSLRELNSSRKLLQLTTAREASAVRLQRVADRLLAMNEKQTISLSNKYAKLSKGNTVGTYAKTIGRDVATGAAVAAGATAAYRSYDKKKNNK